MLELDLEVFGKFTTFVLALFRNPMQRYDEHFMHFMQKIGCVMCESKDVRILQNCINCKIA